jgi:Skp family chaperone for outer membrane proteins
MTMNWKRALFAALLTLALLPAGIAQTKAKVSMADARTAALAVENGKIKSEELEKEKGKQIYSFDIQMSDGVHEVNVDAVTGKVVEDTIENAQDEAKEAAEDKAAKAKKKKAKQPPASDAHPQ